MGLEDKEQTKEIDGVTYKVRPLPFGVGRKTLMRTLKVLSPILSAAFSEDGSKRYSAVFEALPSALSDEDVTYFSQTFGDMSWYQDGAKWVPLVTANQEFHFAARYMTFLRWLMFAMEVNFSGFFAGTAGGGMTDLLAKMTGTASSTV